mmetsp:Transcript_5962/g.18976  ORF Transcript_5962/g.18976 Transcript_5962/m.18976 type:complete len:358 (-) Transcript_5962:161-1234(-)
MHEQCVLGCELQHVRERQVGHVHVEAAFQSWNEQRQPVHRGQQTAVRQHHTLGRASRSRRVHDHSDILWRRSLRRHSLAVTILLHVVERDQPQPLARLPHLRLGARAHVHLRAVGAAVSHDHHSQRRDLGHHALHAIQRQRLRDQHSRLRLVQREHQRVLAQVGVHGGDAAADRERAVGGDLPLRARVGVHGHHVAATHARRVQSRTEVEHALVHLGERCPLVVAQLGGHHLLAVHLLHLAADEAPGAKAAPLRELARRDAHQLLDRLDAFWSLTDDLLESCIPPRRTTAQRPCQLEAGNRDGLQSETALSPAARKVCERNQADKGPYDGRRVVAQELGRRGQREHGRELLVGARGE